MTDRRIRVLIATGTMNAGGAESLIMELLRHHGPSVEYVMLIHHTGPVKAGVYDEEIKRLGITIAHIPSVGSLGKRRYVRLFREKMRWIGPIDVLYSHLNAVGGIVALAAKKAGIPHRIIHSHADITFTGNAVHRALSEIKLTVMKSYVNRFGTVFWACSEAAGKRLFNRGKSVVVIPNCIDTRKYLTDSNKRKRAKERYALHDGLVLGSVGRIAAIKNYEFALSVVKAVITHGIPCEYVVFGRAADENYTSSLAAQVAKLGLKDTVHFMGNSSNVSEDIACMDVFLMPSISEGFGIAAIEAQAAGLPVIASVGVSRETDIGLGLIQYLPFDETVWCQSILSARENTRPASEQVLAAFQERGFDAPFTVKAIEQRFWSMASGG